MGWYETIDRKTGQTLWETTDTIQRSRRFNKFDTDLLCATVFESITKFDHCGVLNILNVFLSQLAPVDNKVNV